MARIPLSIPRRSWLLPYEFHAQPWADILADYREVAVRDDSLSYLVGIVEIVMASPSRALLVGRASSHVHDLNVAASPVGAPPVETIIVRTTTSLRHATTPGSVIIEHSSSTGRDDRIERPVSEAVPLFWRFVMEKFGIPSR